MNTLAAFVVERRAAFDTAPAIRRRGWLELVWAAASAALALLILWRALGLGALDLRVPLLYAGDPLQTSYEYDIAGRHGQTASAATGMPFGSTILDTPNSDGFNIALLQGLDVLTGQFGLAYNLYYLITVLLVGLLSYLAGRRLGLCAPWAFVLSVLFNLIPYHLQRPCHLFLCDYIPAVIATGLSLDMLAAARKDLRWSTAQWAWYVAAALLCGSCGVYYALYSGLLLTATAWLVLAETSRAKQALNIIAVAAVIALAIALNLLPSMIWFWHHGSNLAVAHRHPLESEIYGIKLTDMLMPVRYHRIPLFAQFREAYERSAPLGNENHFATLGAVGALGFLLLLATPFLGRLRSSLPAAVRDCSPLALFCFLWATVGGFGSIFAYVLIPQWRAENRISVFLSFLSLLAILLALQSLSQRFLSERKSWLLCLCLLTVGVLDETPATPLLERQIRDSTLAFNNEHEFLARWDPILPAGSMIFQLPYVAYPEVPPKFQLHEYEQLGLVLQGSRFRWTAGAMNGRSEAHWYELVAGLPADEMLRTLRETGFRGIVVSRKGYADSGADVENRLTAAGLHAPVLSPDGLLAFYPLGDSADPDRASFAVSPERGWFDLEAHDGFRAYWSQGDADLEVANVFSTRTACTLNLVLNTLVARKIRIIDTDRILGEFSLEPGKSTALSVPLTLIAGTKKHLRLETDAPAQVPGNGDPRKLAFYWQMMSPPVCR